MLTAFRQTRGSVLFVTNGNVTDPSSRVRVFQFLPFLRKRLGRVDVLTLDAGGRTGTRLRQMQVVLSALRYQVLVLQKVASVPMLRVIRKLNQRVIWDIDDGVCLVYPQMNAVLPLFERVVVGNEELKNHVESFGGRPTLIPSVVDETRFMLDPGAPRTTSRLVIGWIGHGSNVRYLEPLRQVFERLVQKFPERVCLKIVTDHALRWDLPIESKSWRLEEEPADLRSFDVGIMPLADDEWSRQKCGYKALLYMSQGIPAIVSPVGVNAQIVRGRRRRFPATSPQQWQETLSRLIVDDELRRRVGAEVEIRSGDSTRSPQSWIDGSRC